MKIKTITCHDVYNYGASLQAYALQTYLSNQGHDVEIIDYKPSYMKSPNEFWTVPRSSILRRINNRSIIFRFIYSCCCRLTPKKVFGRKKIFDTFKMFHLKCTKMYSSIDELKQDAPEADCYIAGSDQIWNAKLNNGHDASFFLQFGLDNVKRLSYAASFGISEYDEGIMGHMREWLPKFDAISVREEAGLSLLTELGVDNAVEVADPVFLLSSDDWSELASQSKIDITEPYILVYNLFVTHENKLRSSAVKLAKKYNLKLVAVNDNHSVDYVDQNVNNAGPAEFVWLIKNARFVLSDSFHATAFSIIFNKEFFIHYNKVSISRIQNILNKASCIERLNCCDVCDAMPNDWKRSNELVTAFVDKSKQFINQNL